MYLLTRLRILILLPTIVGPLLNQRLPKIFQVLCWFFALPAFLHADSQTQPFENNRFLKAYATLLQPSAQVLENVALREALRNIYAASGVGIWLDRRIDGEQTIRLSPGQRTHLGCIEELCRQTNTEIAWLENILYIAPSRQSTRIESAYWNLFTSRSSELWQRKASPLKWQVASEVRAIFAQASRSISFRIEGLDRLEHDLWGPYMIPETSLAAQWTCLLSGFDCTLQADSKNQWQIGPMPEVTDVEFIYGKQLQKIPVKRVQEWRTKWPASKVATLLNRSISITAPVAAHRELMAAANEHLIPQQKATQKFDDARFTLAYQGEVGKLLEALAKQLELKIVPWPLPPSQNNQRIQFDVKEVSIDELLNSISGQINASVVRDGKTVTFDDSSK